MSVTRVTVETKCVTFLAHGVVLGVATAVVVVVVVL